MSLDRMGISFDSDFGTITLGEYRALEAAGRLDPPEPKPYDPAEALARVVAEIVERSPAWMVDAACQGAPSEVFFPAKGEPNAYDQARQVCHGCPVRSECLEHALVQETRNFDTVGMWGGMTARERKALRRYRRNHAA